jgi:putative ABC transport system ATP-binding protein
MIKVNNLSKKVQVLQDQLTILNSLSFQVSRGESLAIIGPSGSGKSTLLGILAGLDLPSTGSVHIDGKRITSMSEEARASIRASYVGFVFQSFHLLPGLTALENVALPLELRSESDALITAKEFLFRVGLQDRSEHLPNQLSGGEQQRVAVARAFACQPKILFADEPTGNLDIVTGAKINDLLFELNQEQGTTLVIVTHEQSLAARCARRLHLQCGAKFVSVEEMTIKC